MQTINWRGLLACFVAGGIAVLAFAPFGFYPLIVFSLATLFLSWLRLTPKSSFFAGLAYGYGVYGFGVSWVYVSLSTYGGMPLWMGAIAVLGFAGLLAFFIGAAGYLVTRFFRQSPRSASLIVAMPFVWVIFEWCKSWVLTGFPWLDTGYTQTPSWLFALAPVGGVYLISFSVAVIAAALAWAIARRTLTLPILVIVVTLGSAFLADRVNWSTPYGEPLQVGVVQGNVPINEKWQAEYRDGVIDKFASLSQQLHAQTPTDLIVWPETALPLYIEQIGDEFWRSVTPQGSAILTGIIERPETGVFYNSAALSCHSQFNASGKEYSPQMYRKRHLVPFGEYMPLRFLFDWVLEYLELPMSDSTAWQGQQPLVCGDSINIGLSICYEDAFAAEYRAHVGDATLLVNISEDAWFGNSLAPHQRLQMAQMRARELSRPLVRSANSGPSVIVDQRGAVQAITSQFSVQTLNRKVQPQTGDTLFKRFGNWIIGTSFAVLIGVYGWSRRRTKEWF